jgi:hypothetical protein
MEFGIDDVCARIIRVSDGMITDFQKVEIIDINLFNTGIIALEKSTFESLAGTIVHDAL